MECPHPFRGLSTGRFFIDDAEVVFTDKMEVVDADVAILSLEDHNMVVLVELLGPGRGRLAGPALELF